LITRLEPRGSMGVPYPDRLWGHRPKFNRFGLPNIRDTGNVPCKGLAEASSELEEPLITS
jgi:hypothetical protein